MKVLFRRVRETCCLNYQTRVR